MIRSAHPGDIPQLIAIQQAIESEDAILGYCADTAFDWADRNFAFTYVAVVEREVVGFVHCEPRPYAGESVLSPGSKILEICELLVIEPYRSMGIGQKLMTIVRNEAETQGFHHLRVHSASRRFDEILRFYRRCGFTPWYLEMTMDLAMPI